MLLLKLNAQEFRKLKASKVIPILGDDAIYETQQVTLRLNQEELEKVKQANLFPIETANNLSFVEKDGVLKLKHGSILFSVYDPESLFVRGYWDYMSILPGLADAKSALILGFGCGTIAHQISKLYKDIQIEGVDINEEVIELGKKYFDLPEDLIIHIKDAKQFIQENQKKFDIIYLDVYDGIRVPEAFKNQEFFESVKKSLNKCGFFSMNFADELDIVDCNDFIIKSFENVYKITGNHSPNSIFVCSNSELDFEKIEHFNKEYAPEVFRFNVQNL